VTQILAGFPALRRQQDEGIDAIGFYDGDKGRILKPRAKKSVLSSNTSHPTHPQADLQI
jgi:hypothetical protein